MVTKYYEKRDLKMTLFGRCDDVTTIRQRFF